MKQTFIGLTAAMLSLTGLTACGATTDASPAADVSALSAELPTFSGENVWQMDAAQSTLGFDAYYNGALAGRFTRFQTAIQFDPDSPAGGEIHAAIDLSSVTTKNDDANGNLPSASWFDIKSHPVAMFSATNISAQGDGYLAQGELTLKGITNPADMRFTLDVNGDTARAEGTVTLSRMDYKVGTGSDFATEDWVRFPVTVNIDITATR